MSRWSYMNILWADDDADADVDADTVTLSSNTRSYTCQGVQSSLMQAFQFSKFSVPQMAAPLPAIFKGPPKNIQHRPYEKGFQYGYTHGGWTVTICNVNLWFFKVQTKTLSGVTILSHWQTSSATSRDLYPLILRAKDLEGVSTVWSKWLMTGGCVCLC